MNKTFDKEEVKTLASVFNVANKKGLEVYFEINEEGNWKVATLLTAGNKTPRIQHTEEE